MARLWSSGFELNSTTADMEFTTITGTATVQTSIVRSGTYAGSCNPSASTAHFQYTFTNGTDSSAAVYIRAYIYFTVFPGSDAYILRFLNISPGAASMGVQFIASTSKLRLADSAGTAIGSDSATLSLNTWYMVELMQNDGTTTAEARLDGSSFASSSSITAGNITPISLIRFGISGANVTATAYYDDLAINDTSGSAQTSWPGSGKIVHLRPNAAGDNTNWVALSGSNFQNVDEVTPNDSTDHVRAAVQGNIDDYNLDATAGDLDTNATVNVVQVGMRYQGNSATQANNLEFTPRFKKTASGTVAEGVARRPVNATWRTNEGGTPRNHPITLYQNPDATTITSSTLDTSQIGVRGTTTGNGTDVTRVTAIWLLVDYTPSAGGAATWPGYISPFGWR